MIKGLLSIKIYFNEEMNSENEKSNRNKHLRTNLTEVISKFKIRRE